MADEVVKVVGEAVEVTIGPMSQFFWKVKEIETFQLFVSSPESSPECFGRSVPAHMHWYRKSRIPTVPKMFLFLRVILVPVFVRWFV